MTRVTKKVVLSLDPETQAYKCVGHNLSSEQEAELTEKLKTEGRIFVSFDQEERPSPRLKFSHLQNLPELRRASNAGTPAGCGSGPG